MSEGQAFSKVSKVISISILYFDFGDGDDYIYKGTTKFIGLHNKKELQLNEKQKELYKVSSVEKIYPEYYLIKVKNFNDIAKDTLDEWINFLKNETIPDNPKAKGLKKAKETLDYLKMSDDERREYERYQRLLHDQASAYESTYVSGRIDGIKEGIEKGKKEGIKEGMEKGKAEGEKNKAIEIAKNSLKQGLDMKTIETITGLSKEEIEKLRV